MLKYLRKLITSCSPNPTALSYLDKHCRLRAKYPLYIYFGKYYLSFPLQIKSIVHIVHIECSLFAQHCTQVALSENSNVSLSFSFRVYEGKYYSTYQLIYLLETKINT